MAGSFGYELDLNLITAEEKEAVKQQIKDYKKYWNLIQNGDYYRLHTSFEDKEMAAWCFVAADKSEALLNMVSLTTHANSPVSYVKCKGLDQNKKYKCIEDEMVYDGNALMHTGIPVPIVPGEYHAWQKHFVEQK